MEKRNDLEQFRSKVGVLLNDDKYKEVLDLLGDDCLEHYDEVYCIAVRARCYYKLKKWENAFTNYYSILQYVRNDDQCYLEWIYLLFQLNKCEKVFEEFNFCRCVNSIVYDNMMQLTADLFFRLRDYDNAIVYFNEYSKFQNNNSTNYNSIVYKALAHSYYCVGEYEKSRAYYELIFRDKECTSILYNNYGVLLEEMDGVGYVEYYEKALGLDPESIYAKVNIAIEKFRDKQFREAYDLLKQTSSLGSEFSEITRYLNRCEFLLDLKFSDSVCKDLYRKYRVLFHGLDSPNEMVFLLFKVEDIIEKVKTKLSASVPLYVSHYTKTSVVDIIVSSQDTPHLRYYNASCMNDPEEGSTLSKILFTDEKSSYYTQRAQEDNNIYLGSFIPAIGKANNKDSLVMWRTYGKGDGGAEAAGASMVFRNDFFDKEPTFFANIKPDITTTKKEDNIKKQNSQSLFKVYYVNRDNKVIDANGEENKELNRLLGELSDTIDKIFILDKDDKYKMIKTQIEEIVYNLISHISYLFKSSDYSFENEYRVIQYAEATDSIVKIDETQFPKKLYIESNKDPRNHLVEVVLGPKIADRNHWLYLSKLMHTYNPDFKLTKSTIKFQ